MKRKNITNCVSKIICFIVVMAPGIFSYAQTIDVGTGTTMVVPSGTYITTGGGIKLESSTGAIDNSGIIQLEGDWTNNGSGLINASPGTIVFNGSGSEAVGGSNATTFNNLTVNNATGVNNNVSLSKNATVSGALTFTNGNVATGSNSVIISSSGSISGASASTGWVNGNLEKDYATNSGIQSFKYEIGDAYLYASATLDMKNVNISGGAVNVTGYIDSTDVNESYGSNIDQTKKANRYWFLNENSSPGSFDSYDITLDFTNTTNGGTTANYIMKKFDPSTWASTTSSVSGNTIKATNLTGFSDYEIGESGFVTFNASIFIQGYYLGSGKMSPLLKLLGYSSNPNDVDTMTVELHDNNSPYSTLYTSKGLLESNGSLTCSFPGAASGSYYVVIKYRNTLETWSATAVSISNPYNFTTAATQAYGNNEVSLNDGNFAIYSGDISADGATEGQDGTIDNKDMTELLLSLPIFPLAVYDAIDLTGDGFVDESDYRILQNNIPLGISVTRPY